MNKVIWILTDTKIKEGDVVKNEGVLYTVIDVLSNNTIIVDIDGTTESMWLDDVEKQYIYIIDTDATIEENDYFINNNIGVLPSNLDKAINKEVSDYTNKHNKIYNKVIATSNSELELPQLTKDSIELIVKMGNELGEFDVKINYIYLIEECGMTNTSKEPRDIATIYLHNKAVDNTLKEKCDCKTDETLEEATDIWITTQKGIEVCSSMHHDQLKEAFMAGYNYAQSLKDDKHKVPYHVELFGTTHDSIEEITAAELEARTELDTVFIQKVTLEPCKNCTWLSKCVDKNQCILEHESYQYDKTFVIDKF